MKKRPREVEIFNMSFLDVISCGFGAVILLLVIALAFEPTTIERISKDLRGLIAEKESSREKLTKESQRLSRDLAAKRKSLAQLRSQLSALNSGWDRVQARFGAAQALAREQGKIEAQLKSVQQSLSEEMKRLLRQPDYKPPSEDATIGGIPVDSEYIIFIIDTSGSMKKGAWSLVVKKVTEVLRVYPKVKGIQVLNDMGRYMFTSYKGRWIPDTPARRRAVMSRLSSWQSFSNSSPVEGIYHAIRTFYRQDRQTSIFVFGDDFNGRSISDVITTVARINKKDASGRSRVRIHAFGFPVLTILLKQQRSNFERFAHLMRILAEQNSGSFVGLNALN
jgi:hypothetical protein